MTNDEPRDDEPRDDVDWLQDAFDRALRGDNGTAPDATRPAANPLASAAPTSPNTGETPPVEEPIQRNELDLDFETEATVPAGAFTPVVDFGEVNSSEADATDDDNEPAPDPMAVFEAREQPLNHVEALPTESIDVLDTPTLAVETTAPTTSPTPGAGIDGLDSLFSDNNFSEATTRIISTLEPTVVLPTVASTATEGEAATPKSKFAVDPKVLRIVAFVVGGLVLAVAGFFLGRVVSGPVAVPTPTATPKAPATEMRAPGTWAWTELFGGECIDPYPGAWAEEFTVVSCEKPHAAQLVAVGDLSEIEGNSYPGDDQIGPLVSAECQKQGVLDLSVASAYPNMEVTFAHAANEDDWDDGNTSYYCFVSLNDGSDITGSVQAVLVTE